MSSDRLRQIEKRRSRSHAEATLVARRDVTDDLWTIRLRPQTPFNFRPGQYCTIGVDGIERPYSIVSAPEEGDIELFLELVPPPEGVFTPLLKKLNVGDVVQLRPLPKGIFTFEPKYSCHLMVSTVTGVVPYISILRHLQRQGTIGQWRFHLLQGASYQNEFTYDNELRDLADRYKNITYIPTVSRPDAPENATWTGQTGRVNLIVEEYVQRTGLDATDTLVYACGHPGMIDDVRERMTALGFRVKEERFWKDGEETEQPAEEEGSVT